MGRRAAFLALVAGAGGCAAGLCRPAGLLAQDGGRAVQAASGPIPHVADFRHDGAVGEWRARPIDRILPAAGAIPQALLWIGAVDEGIVVAAEIRSGVRPDEEATLAIGLQDGADPEFPPIGWGHQFGFETLEDETGCAELEFGGEDRDACEDWYLRQVDYRAALAPIFGREWRIPVSHPDDSEEARATPAFARLPAYIREGIAVLEPVGGPLVRSRPIAGTEGGAGIEILILWSAFPPIRAPDLTEVRVSAAWLADEPGPGLDSASPRPLAAPLRHRLTPCGYGLDDLLIPGGEDRFARPASEGAVAYMTPEASGDLRSLVVLDNEAAGYLYEPERETLSPAAFRPAYEVLDVGRGERICTPVLAFAPAGGVGADSIPADADPAGAGAAGAGEGDRFGLQVDARTLDVRRLDDGGLLVRSGPRVAWSYYGSGQCGACPRVGVDVFHIDPESGVITPALRFFQVADAGIRDVEIDVSESWDSVTVHLSAPSGDPSDPAAEFPDARWSAIRYCLLRVPREAATYEECGREADVPEPPNRLRRLYSDGS